MIRGENMWKAINMTGWVMKEHGFPNSRLTVIKRVENTKDSKPQWLCECSCEEHNQIVVSAAHLRDGSTLSCGCLRRELHFELFHKTNEYRFDGDIVIGKYNNCDKEFLFDIEFFEQFSKFGWYEDDNGYTQAWDYEQKKSIKMHQLVAGSGCDHINRKKWDNRKSNLRQASQQKNCQNRSKRSDNTSGVSGVSKDKDGKYLARIQIDTGDRLTLYYGSSKNDAIKARLQAEKKYYGEFAPQKHLFEQYGITLQNDCEVKA